MVTDDDKTTTFSYQPGHQVGLLKYIVPEENPDEEEGQDHGYEAQSGRGVTPETIVDS